MSVYILKGILDLPKPVIVTISLSVFLVIGLAVFVYYMWRNQERSAEVAREVQNITNEIGAGVVEFIAQGDGFITYASKGFYNFAGYDYDEMKGIFGNSFYKMLEDPFNEQFKANKIKPGQQIKTELQIRTREGVKWILLSGNALLKKKVCMVSAVVLDITNDKILSEKVALQK